MNFFERQSQARRKTQVLLFYFVPAVVLTILAVYFAIALALALSDKKEYQAIFTTGSLIHPVLFSWVAGGTLLLIVGASLYKMAELSEGGGRGVAAMLGGSLVCPHTVDPDERRLLDVVEEMSIASGVPVPQIFVLHDEQGINSFAAGFAPGDTVIAVTQGALKLLTRDELQGIVAHEFSHIFNGDAHLNLWMIGVLHGILCISLIGKFVLRGPESDSDSDSDFESSRSIFRSRSKGDWGVPGWLAVVAVLLVVVGSVGYFFGRIIKGAVCRKREELADASAVQFTRNPMAIAGALKKIGGLVWGSRVEAVNVEEANHIFFGDISHESWFPPLRTHPRLRNRILFLDPQFDGHYERVLSWTARQRVGEQMPQQPASPTLASNMVATAVSAMFLTAPSPKHLSYAAGLQASFDPQIKAATREPFGACALVFAVLLSGEESARQQQLTEAEPLANPGLLRQAQEYFSLTDPMNSGQKLALFSLCLTGLRQMSAEQFEDFCKVVQSLIESDRKISLFEYTLQKTLRHHLTSYFQKKRSVVQYYSLSGLQTESAVLFSALAWNGSDDPQAAGRAFQAGKAFIGALPISLVKWDDCNLPQIDTTLEKFSQATLQIKKQIVQACAAVVTCDGVVQESEAQLLRAIAESLDLPLPPFLSELNADEPAFAEVE